MSHNCDLFPVDMQWRFCKSRSLFWGRRPLTKTLLWQLPRAWVASFFYLTLYMKKIIISSLVSIACVLSGQAQFFTNGNLAVVRISGYDTTSSTGAAVFIDQFTTNGQLAGSFAVPTSGPNALILNGQPYEGLLNITPDGTRLVFAGYNTPLPYASNIISSESALVPRVVATLDAYTNFTLAITDTTNFNDSAISSAASDGTNFWLCGTGPTPSATVPVGYNEIAYVGTATEGATNQVPPGNLFTTSMREVTLCQVAGGYELYGIGNASNSAFGVFRNGAYLLSNISGSLPRSTTSATNLLPGHFAFDLAINAAGTIAYMADNDDGVIKFTNTGSAWVSNYTVSLTNAQGPNTSAYQESATSVTADWSQDPPVVYATTGESITNRLVMFQDTNASGVDTVITLAQGSIVSGSGGVTNTFRGVRFVPGAYPLITSQPESVTNDSGQTISFSVSATGTPNLAYQWYSNSVADPTFVAVPSGTNATLSLASIAAGQSNSIYYVIVSNPYGTAQSSNATLIVNPPGPPINIQVTPGSQRVDAGTVAVFNATFVGASTSVSYGWTLNGIPLTDGSLGGSSISGSTTASLTISNAFAVDDGSYEVFITNTIGNASGGPGVLRVNDPAIITNVMGVTNLPGTSPVILSVAADGTGLTYQWLSNGIAISGANSATYSVPNSAVTLSASYSVIISNSLGVSVTNGPAVVAYSPYLLYDAFTYPDGNLFGEAGSPWKEISGVSPILVLGDRVQIAQTNTVAGTAFAQSLYTQPQSGAVMWASFIINLTSLPSNPGGTYFAHFEDTNFGFYGRIFAVTSNNPAYTPDLPTVACPGTYRLGVSGKAGSPSAVVELDMAPGIDYQVVAYFDMNGGYSQLAVNPGQSDYSQVYSGSTTPTTLASAATSDTFTPPSLPMAAYGLREAAGGGVFEMDNLEVSYDWQGPGSGFAAVTAGLSPTIPVIGFLTPGVTNYSGNSNILEVAASGIDLSYAWFQDGVQLTDATNLSGSATPTLALSYLVGAQSGNYTVVVSNEAGAVTSSVAVVSVDTTATAPIFTLEPVSTTNSLGANVTFAAAAVGTGPITYQWNTDGSPNGATGSSYTLTRITTNLSGTTYSVTATGGTGLSTTSSNAVLTVLGPVVTNIAFLRSLQVTSAAPTITVPASNSTTVYQVTGVVTTFTNLESATYAEYWVQDSTAGIEFFVVDPTFRPHLGDVVSVSGIVDVFDNALELDGSANNPSEPYYVVSTNGESSPLPYAPHLIPFGFATANPGLSSLIYQGSLGTFTNVYFATPGAVIGNQDTLVVTNKAGQIYYLYTGSSDGPDIIGQTVPAFAYSVTGAYDQFQTEYELNLTAGSDIVTAPPPPVTDLTAAVTASNVTLAWTAVPAAYTYSVWSTTNLSVPFAPLAPGLWFTNASGSYTAVVSTNNPATFYEIVSP